MNFKTAGRSRKFRYMVPILVLVGVLVVGAAAGAAQLVELLSVNSSQGHCSTTGPDSFECDLATLQPGETAFIQVSAQPHVPGRLLNTAIVSSNEYDLDPTDDRDDEDTLVIARPSVADVAVHKSDSHDPARVGQPFTYHLIVFNHGPDPAPDVQVVDRVPFGVTLSNVSTPHGNCRISANLVDCALGTMPVGAQATVAITVIPHLEGGYLNEAAVSTSGIDPDGNNNVDIELTDVLGQQNPAVDLHIVKGDHNDPVYPGEVITYTIRVTNEGPSAATGVMVRDIMEFLAANSLQNP